jgi:hypothetical protein
MQNSVDKTDWKTFASDWDVGCGITHSQRSWYCSWLASRRRRDGSIGLPFVEAISRRSQAIDVVEPVEVENTSPRIEVEVEVQSPANKMTDNSSSDHQPSLTASARIDKMAFDFHRVLLYDSNSDTRSLPSIDLNKVAILPAGNANVSSAEQDHFEGDDASDIDCGIVIGDDAYNFRSRRSSQEAALQIKPVHNDSGSVGSQVLV